MEVVPPRQAFKGVSLASRLFIQQQFSNFLDFLEMNNI